MNIKIEKNKKNIFTKNDRLLIKVSKLYLFPLYIIGILLKIYDILEIKLKKFINEKLLKKKKQNKVEDWWIT